MSEFDRHASPAQVPSWPDAEERYAYIRAVLERHSPPPADLVELGAAPGALSVALARQGYRVTAVDLGEASDAWAGEASGTMASAFESEGIVLVLWDLEVTPYPLPDSSSDVVLLTEVLEHLRDYPLRALSEVRRILRPGGSLLITTPNSASIQKRLRLLRGLSVHTPLADWMYGLPHARHAREYTSDELRELVTHAGLTVEFIKARHFHLHSGRQNRLAVLIKHAIDRMARSRTAFGPGLVVLARRPEESGNPLLRPAGDGDPS